MIGKDWKFKNLDFTNSVQMVSQRSNGYCYFLTDVIKNVPLRTDTFDRANFHGGYSTNTLAGSRLFTFTGKIIGTTKAQRDIAWNLLIQNIKPEGNPNIINSGFYDLYRKTDGGADRTCKAKVFSMPEPINGLNNPIIEFTFSLFCETEKIYGIVDKTITGNKGLVGGVTLGATLPTYLGGYGGYFPVTNEGNWLAPCKIQIIGQATNPQIINLTNGNKYKINGVTDNLIIDNRNLNNLPTELLIVTNNGENIKGQRDRGADIFLEAGVNHLVVLTDELSENPLVYVTFRDCYI